MHDSDATLVEPYTTALPTLRPEITEDLRHLVEAWVASKRSENTRIAYRRDLISESPRMATPSWIVWCLRANADPLTVRQPYVDAYARELEVSGSTPATVARKLASISSWYTYLIRQEIVEKNPAKWAARPEIDKDTSNAVGLSEDELARFIAVADADGLMPSAIARMLALNGVRVGVITAATIGSLGHDRGHRVIKYKQKGGKDAKAPLAPVVTEPLDAYLAGRGIVPRSAPLFATVGGDALDESYVWRMVRSICRRAEIAAWEEISPHSLRHTFATLALGMGIPLAEVQDAMGHKDPRTTQRYNRARYQLDGHPTYALAGRILPKSETEEQA